MKLFVKSLSDGSQPVTVDVPCDVTVDHFRSRVAEHLSVPDAQVRLVFAGRVLENGNPISAYDVFENASIIAVINKTKVPLTNSQQSSLLEPTDCDLDSAGILCAKPAKRRKLDDGSSLVCILRELIRRACEFPIDNIYLKSEDQTINDDTSFYKRFPQTSEMCGTRTCDTSTTASGNARISSNTHTIVIRITRERKSEENLCKSFDVICEVEKTGDSLTARIVRVSAEVGTSLSSIPSSTPNGDHPVDVGPLPGIDSAESTRVFFYQGSAKFVRDLIAKESSVKSYLVFLEMNGCAVHDSEFLTAYCNHSKNSPSHEHELQHRIFRSPMEEIAWRMNNDVCSKREFLSYITGLPEIQPLTADPDNIRKMLLTYPLLKRLYKRFSEIKRILHWNDYLLYRLKMFENPECLPSSDYVSLDPVGWNQLMIDWPVVQQLYARYPEIRSILMWEEYLSYRTSLVTNPSFLALHREVTRNQDRMMAHYERYSEYSGYTVNTTEGETEPSSYEHYSEHTSEVPSLQNPNYSVLSEPGEEIRSSDDDLRTYYANISKFANKLLKNCPQFNDAILCNPFMQRFADTLATDSRLIDGIVEEAAPEVKDNPQTLARARDEIPKIMKQLCDPEGRDMFSAASARDGGYLDPASQVMNALEVLRKAGYPVSEILGPSNE